MAALQFLELDGSDRLRCIGAGAFAGVPALHVLHVRNNRRLSAIDAHAFAGPVGANSTDVDWAPELRELRLSGNNLTQLPDGLLPAQSWRAMQLVALHDNPWTCGCAPSWLQSVLVAELLHSKLEGGAR